MGCIVNKLVYNNLCFFLLGLLVFSTLSSTITLEVLHTPFSLPELLFVPFMFLLRGKFRTCSFDVSRFLISCIGLVFLVALGALIEGYTLYELFADMRAWIYLFLFYFIFKRDNDIHDTDLMYLSFGSLVGWLFASLMNIRLTLINSELSITYGAMLAIPIFLSTVIQKRKKILLILGFAVMVVIFFSSGIRRVLVPIFVSLLIIVFLYLRKNKRRIPAVLVVSTILIIGIVSLLPLIEELVKGTSYALYHRIFVRTETLLTEGADASDTARINNFKYLFDNIIYYTFPHGLISLQTGAREGIGIFNDFPLLQVCHIFGWPMTIFFIIHFLKITISNRKCFIMTNNTDCIVAYTSLIVMFALLFLEGAFLEYPFATPITGLILGRASRYRNVVWIQNREI